MTHNPVHTADTPARAPIPGRQSPERTSTDAAPHSVGASPHRRLTADIAVIGGGSGGLSVAAGAAMLGLKVVLFEKGEMGGDCLNTGCVPSKALLAAARAAHDARNTGRFGVEVSGVHVDWPHVRAHVSGVIDQIAPVDSQERFESLGVTVIREHARFAGKDTIVSATTSVKARRIVIATGSRASAPPIPGLDTTPYLTNETIFSVAERPAHLVILGGGPIGMEMAQAFVRLGANVTVIEKDRALARADRAHAARAVEILRAEGVNILEGHAATRISKEAGGVSVIATSGETHQETTITGSHLLVALGRTPVMDALDLEAGNVAHDRSGITTKPNLRSVSNGRVWAVGDIAGQGQFTHLAGFHASVFVRNALFKTRFRADSTPVPAVTYIEPEIAQIGLTEDEAREKYGDDVSAASFLFHENDRAIAERSTEGEVKYVIRKGRIIGASIFGESAGDLLHIPALAMTAGLKVKDLTSMISPYPTRGEATKRAASKHFESLVFGKSARRLVGLLQRIP